MSYPAYEVLQVAKPADHVIHVQLNRPDKSNAMNGAFIRYTVHVAGKLTAALDHTSIGVGPTEQQALEGLQG